MIPGIGNRIISGLASGQASRAAFDLSNTFTLPDGATTYVVGDKITFSKASGITTFPVRNGANFKISLYGAGGGNFASDYGYGGNANGGIMIATINLSSYQNTNLTFVRGAGGGNATNNIDASQGVNFYGGYNGGGNGAGVGGPGGGGRTDLRTGAATSDSQYYNTELLVACGGGGGNGTMSSSGSRYWGNSGCSGDTNGDGTGYGLDNGGGGGGYYGGQASCSDDGRDAGSGTNYYDAAKTVTVHTNTRITGTNGGNNGAGYFIVEVMSVA